MCYYIIETGLVILVGCWIACMKWRVIAYICFSFSQRLEYAIFVHFMSFENVLLHVISTEMEKDKFQLLHTSGSSRLRASPLPGYLAALGMQWRSIGKLSDFDHWKETYLIEKNQMSTVIKTVDLLMHLIEIGTYLFW